MIISGFYFIGDSDNDTTPSPATNNDKLESADRFSDDLIERDEDGNIISIGLPVDNLNLRPPSVPSTSTGGTRGQWDSIIMSEDFENANWWAKWYQLEDEDPNSNLDWWGRDNDAPYVHAGSWSANCSTNFSGSASGGAGIGYDNNMASWMTYGPIDLSSTANFERCAKLTFWYWLDCQPNNNDFFFFGTSNGDAPGGTMTFYSPSWHTQSLRSGRLKYWRWVDYNLTDTPVIGQNLPGDPNVYIAFYFKSDTSLCGLLPQGYKGAYLDDITLWNYTNHAPLTPINLNVSAPYGNTRRVVDHTPILNWTFNDQDTGPEEKPTGFHIQVGTDDDWAAAEMANVNQTYNGYLAPRWTYASANPLLDGQRYYFRVKARDNDFFWGPWSQSFNFSMNDEPTVPTLTDPTSAVIWDGGPPDSHWVNWTIATNNDDNPPGDDTIEINISLSTNGGLNYTKNVTLGQNNDGNFYWNPIFNDVESNQCVIRVTAYDGFEETHAYTPIMTIDSFDPVINDIVTMSTKPWYYEDPGMSGSGGTVWFNSLAGEGSGQILTMNIDWADASKIKAEGTLAFGDTPTDMDIDPVSLDYSVETGASNFNGVTLTVTDYFGRTDTATLDFKVDNTDPTVPLSVICRPDGYLDVGEADNDTEIYVTWTDGNDGTGSGISHSIIYTTDILAAVKNINKGEGIWISPVWDVKITVNVSMVDRVGNIGPATGDDIIIDFTNPSPPVVYSDTHSDSAEWYSNNNPILNWSPPQDLSGINGYSYILDQVVDTIPAPTLSGTMTTKRYYVKADGVWYFHLRALDNASHWGSTTLFTVNIDTTSPSIMKDYSDKSATTGELVYFKVEANDELSGVGEVRLYWRYNGETSYRIVSMEPAGTPDQYDTEFTVQADNAANIEYYITVNDTAIPVNTAYTPDKMIKEFEEITVNDNDLPAITEITGDIIGYTGDITTIEVNTSDNVDTISAKIFIGKDKLGQAMTESPDNKFTFDIDVPDDNLDDIDYYVKIWDAASNSVRSPQHTGETYTVTVKDNDAPVIQDVTGNTVGSNGQSVELFIEATDNYDFGNELIANLYVGTESEINDDPTELEMDHVSGSKFRISYNIPNLISTDLKYYITATDTSLNTARIPATGEYTIYIPAVLTPNGGEVWNGTQNIIWTTKDMQGSEPKVDIYYWDEAANLWTNIAKGEPDDGIFMWDTTTLKDGMNYKVKIVILYTSDLIGQDESDNAFRIYNPDKPELEVRYPIGGERLTGATIIQWQATDADGDEISVRIEYRDAASNETDWTLLALDDQNKGNFTWNTKTLPDGEYYLRISAIDRSPEQFSAEYTTFETIEVDNELSITILAPSTGDTWSGSKNIEWDILDAHGNTIYFTIQYRKSTDSPTDWTDLTTENLQNVDTYKWDTTAVLNGEYFIKINGYVTLGGEREGEAISQQFRVKNKGEEPDQFAAVFSWLIIIIIIVLIIVLVIVMMMRKKKHEEELKKEAKDLKAKESMKPPEVPSGPQYYAIPPTRPEPLFPVEQQRYKPIPPPPPKPQIPAPKPPPPGLPAPVQKSKPPLEDESEDLESSDEKPNNNAAKPPTLKGAEKKQPKAPKIKKNE